MKHFLDVGANNGSTFDRFLCKTQDFDGAKVWCFEPSPRSWATLSEKAHELGYRFDITLCPFGLGGETGVFPFYQQRESEGDTFIAQPLNFRGEKAVSLGCNYTLQVPMIAAADFIFSHTHADDEITLKLDCEGAEYAILDDLLAFSNVLGRFKRIMVEWHWVSAINFVAQRQRLEKEFSKSVPLELWPY